MTYTLLVRTDSEQGRDIASIDHQIILLDTFKFQHEPVVVGVKRVEICAHRDVLLAPIACYEVDRLE